MDFSKKALKLAQEYEKILNHKPSKKSRTGSDFTTQSKYIEVKSFEKKSKYLHIYSTIFKHLSKTKFGFDRYYIYVVFDKKHPKMIIIPPNRIFRGINPRKLFDITLGDYWNYLSVNLSSKIYKGLKIIDLKEFFKKYRKLR